MYEPHLKTDVMGNIMRQLRSSFSGLDLSAPNAFRALLAEMSVVELEVLDKSPSLMGEAVRIMTLPLSKIEVELESLYDLKAEGWPRKNVAHGAEDFYISASHLEEVRPSWARNKTFSVGYYAETREELLYIGRYLLMLRVRLSLWKKIAGARIARYRSELRSKVVVTRPHGTGNYM